MEIMTKMPTASTIPTASNTNMPKMPTASNTNSNYDYVIIVFHCFSNFFMNLQISMSQFIKDT